jgi:Fe-S-cluster containining protein
MAEEDPEGIATTFPPTLRYRCDIESCVGCCSFFEEIELSRADIQRLEGLGYSSFYQGNEACLLRKPCVFLQGKLCRIHLRHGVSAKPEACRKYPFSLSLLDNGWVLVDIKWACSGVGREDGRALTHGYIKRELSCFMGADKPRVPVGDFVPVTDKGGAVVSWVGVKELYEYASRDILLQDLGLREKVGTLAYLLKGFTESLTGKRRISREDVAGFLTDLRLRAVEAGPGALDAEIRFYGAVDDILSLGATPVAAARRLGLELEMGPPRERPLSREAEEVYSLYLSQCLMETLSKPWSVRASFYWALGVMGLVDFVARCMGSGEIGRAEVRKAVAVVDFMNKGYREFRAHAYPRYPELGLSYLGTLLRGYTG